ncbi:MAG: DUF1273 family protein [Ruminococcus sp.]|nr:DUF1273 family protein [Ruminococcus sp.]
MVKITAIDQFVCDRSATCCITGHRRRDLPFGGDMRTQGMKCLVSMLDLLCEEAYRDGFRTFISGMAEGVDLTCAKLIREKICSGRYPGMRLVCALPYKEQYKEISDPLDGYYYSMIIGDCDEKVVVSCRNDRQRYRLRNQFMVDNSSRIIGAYKRKERGSGTLQTINMAKKSGLDLQIISLDGNPLLYCDSGAGQDTMNFTRI